jgi:hypothetical protein
MVVLAQKRVFWYLWCMQINFNPRGNGACPLCKKHDDCFVHEKLRNGATAVKTANGTELELVVYACPFFVETD